MAVDTVIIRERLTRAREQYDKLMNGKAVRVIVDQNGERVEFSAVKSGDLAQYIRELEQQLGAATGGRPVVRGPLRFMW